MGALILSLRMLRRDWRAGELRILTLALIVAVASVTAVGFFTDRIQQALAQQANELLGADLVITSSHPFPVELLPVAQAHDVRIARTMEFPSMVIAGEQSRLASVRAVSEAYPLRGGLRITGNTFSADEPAQGIPERGSVWLESKLLGLLGVDVGGVITLGSSDFVISAVLTNDPSRAYGNLFSL